MRQRQNETTEEFKSRVAEYQKTRNLRIRKWLADYKISIGCTDCGYKEHHAALEFDHLIPRNGDRSKIVGISSKSIESMMKEINNCQVVCATCHRIREYNRRNMN